MKKAFYTVLVLLISLTCHAEEWMSPVDIKYQKRNGELFKQYVLARDSLDTWRGEPEYLKNSLTLLNEVIKKDDNFAPAYRELGRLYIMAGYINNDNYKSASISPAEGAILKSIDIEPEYADAYVLLGHLYTNTRNFERAQQVLEKAKIIGTKSPWLQLNLANLYLKTNKSKLAEENFQNVIDSHTQNKKAYEAAIDGLISYHFKAGNYPKVSELHRKAIAYNPKSAWSWGNYASFLIFTMGDADGAIENAEKALSIMNYGAAKFTLATALYTKWAKEDSQSKNSKTAIELFERAQKTYPDIEAIVASAEKYKATQITAESLKKYMINHNSLILAPKKP